MSATALTSANPHVARIKKVSALMHSTVTAIMAVLVIAFVWMAFDGAMLARAAVALTGGATQFPLAGAARWGFWALLALPLLLFLAGLWQVRRLFESYARGQIFTLAAARTIRRAGVIALAIVPVQILVNTLSVLLLTAANPPGQRQLAIGVSSTELAVVVIGMTLIVMGWVMGEAVRISDENSQFV